MLVRLTQMQSGAGNARAELLAEIERAANRFGTTTAELQASGVCLSHYSPSHSFTQTDESSWLTGNSDLLREIEAAATTRQQKSAGQVRHTHSVNTHCPVQNLNVLVFLGGQVLSNLQATGAQRAAVPQAEAAAITVLQAMAAHTDNAGVQAAGCSALWSMAYQNPYNRSAMGRQGKLLTLHTHTHVFAGARACARPCVCV